MRADILVLSAHRPELSGLTPLLGDDFRRTVRDLDVVAAPVGIGLPAAAAGTSAHLHAFAPRGVVLLGTCGAYAGRGVALGQVVVGTRLFLVSAPVVEGRAAFPAPMSVAIDASPRLSEAVAGNEVQQVRVATTLAITTDDDLAARMAGHDGCDVEHLEAFAVAAACAALSTPLAIVLGVANIVGSKAREEWTRNHRAAGQAASSVVAEWLERGAPGLGART